MSSTTVTPIPAEEDFGVTNEAAPTTLPFTREEVEHFLEAHLEDVVEEIEAVDGDTGSLTIEPVVETLALSATAKVLRDGPAGIAKATIAAAFLLGFYFAHSLEMHDQEPENGSAAASIPDATGTSAA